MSGGRTPISKRQREYQKGIALSDLSRKTGRAGRIFSREKTALTGGRQSLSLLGGGSGPGREAAAEQQSARDAQQKRWDQFASGADARYAPPGTITSSGGGGQGGGYSSTHYSTGYGSVQGQFPGEDVAEYNRMLQHDRDAGAGRWLDTPYAPTNELQARQQQEAARNRRIGANRTR